MTAIRQWQLQEAKMRFSELVKQAVNSGPQQITVHGKITAILISREEYDSLTKPEVPFLQFLAQSPLAGLRLRIKRDKSKTRKVDL